MIEVVVAGGPGRPDGFPKGYFVKPTVFADVRDDMTIAREEIFGPVLSIIPYEDEDDAVRIANDTPFGLSGLVTSGNLGRARSVARRIRSGNVYLNGARSTSEVVLEASNSRATAKNGRGRHGRVPRIKSSFRLCAREIGFTCGIMTCRPPKLGERTKTGERARYPHNPLAHIHLSEFAD